MDPLNDMKKHLGEKRKISEKALSESAVQEKRKCLEAPPSQSYAQVSHLLRCVTFTYITTVQLGRLASNSFSVHLSVIYDT